MLRSTSIALAAAALAGAASLQAAEPEDIIKYRQAVMKSVGGHMGAAAQIVRGKVQYPDDLGYHADAIARSMKTVHGLFPVDSDFGETRALPAVWDKPDEFKKVGEDAAAAAAEFAAAAGGGDPKALVASFKQLADACKACHKDFREEDE